MIITIDLPQDARAHVLACQAQTRIEKNIGQYSQEKTIVAIILQHKELQDELTRLKGSPENNHHLH